MENKSGIHPRGHRLLVLPIEVEHKSSGGIFLPKEYTDKIQMAQVSAILIEAGKGAWKDTTEPGGWAKPGDTIMIGKFVGVLCDGKDGKKYRVINDLDLIAVMDAKKVMEVE